MLPGVVDEHPVTTQAGSSQAPCSPPFTSPAEHHEPGMTRTRASEFTIRSA